MTPYDVLVDTSAAYWVAEAAGDAVVSLSGKGRRGAGAILQNNTRTRRCQILTLKLHAEEYSSYVLVGGIWWRSFRL